jgi:hypothetical protein
MKTIKLMTVAVIAAISMMDAAGAQGLTPQERELKQRTELEFILSRGCAEFASGYESNVTLNNCRHLATTMVPTLLNAEQTQFERNKVGLIAKVCTASSNSDLRLKCYRVSIGEALSQSPKSKFWQDTMDLANRAVTWQGGLFGSNYSYDPAGLEEGKAPNILTLEKVLREQIEGSR